MDYIQKKELLKSYGNIVDKLRSLQEQKSSIMEIASSPKAIVYDDMPKGNKQSDISDIMVKIDKIDKQIEQVKTELLNQKLDIESAIISIKDAIECDILRKRYLELKSWDKIYKEIGFSARDTHRKHKNAVLNINLA